MELCKKIERGIYEYRRFKIMNRGYSETDHHIVWEAIDIDTESICLPGLSKKECLIVIDVYLKK